MPTEVRLGRGMSDVQIKEAVVSAGAYGARVLHLESAEGVFGGVESSQEDKLFRDAIYNSLLGGWSATWCCTSWDKPRGTFKFKRPLPLPSGELRPGDTLRMPLHVRAAALGAHSLHFIFCY